MACAIKTISLNEYYLIPKKSSRKCDLYLNNAAPHTCHNNIYIHIKIRSCFPTLVLDCSCLKPDRFLLWMTRDCRERHNLAHYEECNWGSVVVRMLSEINRASGSRPPASELLGSCNETNNISCLGRLLSTLPFSVGSQSWGRRKPGTYGGGAGRFITAVFHTSWNGRSLQDQE